MSFQIKNIVPSAFWGFRQVSSERLDAVLPINDHQIVFVVGSRLAILDHVDSNKSKLTYLGPKKVAEILLLALSPDLKFVAASVRILGSNATMLIHQIVKLNVSNFRAPKILQHSGSNSYDGITFSANSELIAAFTDIQSQGILIYDRIKEVLIRSVNIGTHVSTVSFNPEDSSRICTTGEQLQFWRYTAKAIHNAPIAGLQNRDCNYTCHVWLHDKRVVVGTDTGELVVVHQSTVQSIHQAFGSAEYHNYELDGKVRSILCDENHVIAVSSTNCISIFGIIKFVAHTGTVCSLNTLSALQLKAKYRLHCSVTEIKGIQLNIKLNQQLDSSVLVVTNTCVCSFLLTGIPVEGQAEQSTSPLALRQNRPTSPVTTKMNNNNVDLDWIDLPGKIIYTFHGNKIDTLCLSSRSSSFVTSSIKDNTVRIWDSCKPFASPDVIEDYSEHSKDMPIKLDLHPSGWTLASVTKENIVTEYAITLSGLISIRQVMNAKIPFVSSDGVSYANTSTISILKV